MKAERATTAAAQATAAMATARSFLEEDLNFWVWGRMREEMLAGKEAKAEGEGGGGGEGYVGKKGAEEEALVLGVVEKGYLGFGGDGEVDC